LVALAGCSGPEQARGVPEEVIRHNVLGTAYLGQQNSSEAEQAFRTALELRPHDPLLLNNLAVSLIQQGRLEEAEALLQQVVGLDADHPYARYNLGSIWKNLGNFEEAAEQFESVERFDPDDLMTHYNLGMIYFRLGRESEAEAQYRRALELDPTHVSTLYALGRLLIQRGEQDEGMAWLARSQEIRARSGLDVAVGSQYGEQGPYAMGADYPGDALAAPSAIPVDFVRLAAGVLGTDGREVSLVQLAVAPRPPENRLTGFAVDTAGALRPFDIGGLGPAIISPPAFFAVATAAGDVTGDGTVDLVALTLDEQTLAAAVLPSGMPGRAAPGDTPSIDVGSVPEAFDLALVDRDHDGDLDLFFCWTATAAAGCAIGTNDGSGGLEIRASSEHGFRPTPVASDVVRVGFSDVDNDRDIDLLLARAGRVDVFANERDGNFEEISDAVGLGAAVSDVTGTLAVADLDKNGWMDLVLGVPDGARVHPNRMGRFQPGRVFETDAAGPLHAVVFDHDNDGFLDLALPAATGMRFFRNLGAGDWDGEGIEVADPDGGSVLPVAAFDADQDGDLDLATVRSLPEPELVLLSNEGGNANHWIRVASRGLADNTFGVGAKVEILAGGLRQKHEVIGPLPLHQGLGSRETVESVRHLWPSGILQDEVALRVGSTVEVEQLDRKGTSCPLLYAREDGGWRFVTDFLGGAAVGYRLPTGSFNVPDTDEYVKIEGGIAPDPDGTLRLRVNNQLQEVIWFDRLELVVVDHPAGTEIFPNERLMPGPPWPAFDLFASADIRPVRRAHAVEDGADLTELLARRDRRYISNFGLRPFKGYADPHTLELDLGPFVDSDRVVLLLDGWIDYADSTANVAASQAGVRLVPPELSIADGRGGWRGTEHLMGFPAGLPKTMTVDLTGQFHGDDHRLRIATNMRIYWDRARVLVGGEDVPLQIRRIPASRAELRPGGFPAATSPDGLPPFGYDARAVSWRSAGGGRRPPRHHAVRRRDRAPVRVARTARARPGANVPPVCRRLRQGYGSQLGRQLPARADPLPCDAGLPVPGRRGTPGARGGRGSSHAHRDRSSTGASGCRATASSGRARPVRVAIQ
jgi:Flp pilus assembly protein TadD